MSGNTVLDEKEREKIDRINELLVEQSTTEEVDAHLSEALSNLLVDEVEITDENNNDDRVLAMAAKVKRDYFAISELTRL